MITSAFCNNDKDYINADGELDFVEIYNDGVSYLKEQGVFVENANDSIFKKTMIDVVKTIVTEFANSHFDNSSYDEIVNTIEQKLITKYNIPKGSFASLSEYEKRLSSTISNQGDSSIKEYANELVRFIDNSNLTEEQKKSIKFSSDVMINSWLFWIEELGLE